MLLTVAHAESRDSKICGKSRLPNSPTYADEGKSGVVLNRREALRKLLDDVERGNPDYKAILVYDVSRWGRFQNSDEAAHYEFLCTRSGRCLHYCAEQFANDDTPPLKSLKRSMAAEFSRELGIKVFEGKCRLVKLGFFPISSVLRLRRPRSLRNCGDSHKLPTSTTRPQKTADGMSPSADSENAAAHSTGSECERVFSGVESKK